MIKKTPLYQRHVSSKGKMVSFAGYQLPVQYETGIIKEHMAVREKAGIFDVSHMGEFILKGKDALDNIQRLMTNDFSKMYDGQVKYSPMCNEEGGIIDDLLIYRKNSHTYLLVVNAANREKDSRWIQDNLIGDVTFEDVSDDFVQIALQGPNSNDILIKLVDENKLPEKYYTFKEDVDLAGVSCLISRTGYTGEDGFELYCSSKDGPKLWDELLKAGSKSYGLIPSGLGARDTLRLEAGMPLYGNEMNESISPLEAGLAFTVKFDKEDFIGKKALVDKGQPERTRVGMKIIERGIAREGNPVYVGDKLIGQTTSGTHSPYLGYPIAMAYVDKDYSDVNREVEVEIRGRKIKATVVNLPFYKRPQ